MKSKRVKRILALIICAVLTVTILPVSVFASSDEPADTPAASDQAPSEKDKTPAETEKAPEENKETDKAPSEEKDTDKASAETKSGTDGETAGDTSGEGSDAAEGDTPQTPPVIDEPPNTDIVVIPSDANALILMDVGAQSPKGVPGDIVTIVLPMAVNKEYLPSERYMLRNINVQLALRHNRCRQHKAPSGHVVQFHCGSVLRFPHKSVRQKRRLSGQL